MRVLAAGLFDRRALAADFAFDIFRLYSTPMLHDNPSAPREQPIFSAILTPYRSLGRRGFMTLMLSIGIVCFASGLPFLILGAWPVFLFFGLDVLLIWFAFMVNYRAARAFEEVEVFPEAVTIRRVSPAGRVETHQFNPYWARLSVQRIEDEGVVRITLSSHGASLDVGGFLNAPDKETFADAFARALNEARSMPAPQAT
ncbi:MAG: DUF2244 domain-containing protein [Pseudomonadota bacterium]